jgi:hypothetical protein
MSYSNVIRGAAALIGVLIVAQSMAATSEEELVCRYEPRPGSRVLSHTCLTEAQWTAIDKAQTAVRALLPAGATSAGATGVMQNGPAQNWGGFQRY